MPASFGSIFFGKAECVRAQALASQRSTGARASTRIAQYGVSGVAVKVEIEEKT